MNKVLCWALPLLVLLLGCESQTSINQRSATRLSAIMLAWFNYESRYREFPDNIRDAEGKPLLSWRVRMLSDLEHGALLEQIHLDEPWNSPHNSQFHTKMPDAFANPKYPRANYQGLTTYLAPIHEGTIYGAEHFPKFPALIKDGLRHTIVFVEAPESEAVPWMKPVDLPVDPEKPLEKLLPPWRSGFNAAFAYGTVKFISRDFDPKLFAKLLTWNGQEEIP